MAPTSLAGARPRVMLVTGAASGIGRHLTGVLSRSGHRIWASDVNEDQLRAAAEQERWDGGRVELSRLDVRDPAAWGELVARLYDREGRLDVLLNVAGIVLPGWVHEATPEAARLHLEVNALGVIHGTQAAAARMVPVRAGHIVNIASLAGIAAVPGLALYTASKFAVRGYSLAAAQELREYGVNVTVVCPDAVLTPMVDLQVDYPEAAITFSGRRMLTVEDIARVIEGRVLPHRPLEVMIPGSRGWISKLTSLWPGLASAILPLVRRQGLARQTKTRTARQQAPRR